MNASATTSRRGAAAVVQGPPGRSGRLGGPAQPARRARQAPGPGGLPIVGSLLAFRRDVLGLMLRGMRDYGDVVRFRLGPLSAYLVCHPDGVEHVLRDPHGYDKDTRASKMIRLVTGDALLVTNGPMWRKQRCLVQPALAPARVDTFLPLIVDATHDMLAQWDRLAQSGQPIDLPSQMMRLTYRIIEQALFSTRTIEGLDTIEAAITEVMAFAYARVGRVVSAPMWMPTPANRRFRRALALLDQRVYRIINEHRGAEQGGDLLSAMMRAGREADGRMIDSRMPGDPVIDDKWLRDQTITLLLAGHETTANAMVWLWRLLAEHRAADERVHDEARAVLGAGPLSREGVEQLVQTDMVVREAMRLYTPIWAIVRRARRDDIVAGVHIPKGARVVISPYVTHRHPGFWDAPEVFDPGRFTASRSAGRHPYAYIPFGAGGRYCVGQHLAMLEARVITAMIAQRFRLRLAPGQRIEPAAGITLRPRGGVTVILERREASR